MDSAKAVSILLRNADLWLLALVTLLGGILRFTALARQSLWIDEGFSVVHALAILEHGYPLLPTGVVSWSYLPVHYLMALGIKAVGNIEVGGRLFSALAGTLLIPVFYGFNLRLFRSRWQAVLAACLLALLTYEVAWSRQARGYVVLQLFIVLALTSFHGFLDARKPWMLAMSAGCLLLAIAAHRAGYVAAFVVVAGLLLEVPRFRSWRPWLLRYRLFAFAVVLGVLSVVATLSMLATNSALDSLFEQTRRGVKGFKYLLDYSRFAAEQWGFLLAWALLGIGISLRKHFVRTVPLVLAGLFYLYATSFRTLLFHFRYLLPVWWLVPAFAAYGAIGAWRFAYGGTFRGRRYVAGLVAVLFAGSLATADFTLWPRSTYLLGYTAPQPDWRAAYRWVEADAAAPGLSLAAMPATVSTFPMFSDLYLGRSGVGGPFFLPFSRSGFPGEFQEASRYSRATTVATFDDFAKLHAYVILDHFGLRMLKDPRIRGALMRVPPDHIVQGEGNFDVFIWRPRPAGRVRTPVPGLQPPPGVPAWP